VSNGAKIAQPELRDFLEFVDSAAGKIAQFRLSDF
jgi:hypothetical protein